MLKDAIVNFLEEQLRGTIFPLEDIRRIINERLGLDFTLRDVAEAVDELEIEGKVIKYVRLA
jgi:hypothetical protein